jgi:hypothetical protein
MLPQIAAGSFPEKAKQLFSRKSKAVHGAELSNPDWNGIIEAVTLAANKNNDSTSTNGAKRS